MPDPAFAFRSQHVAATAPVQRLQVYAPIVTGDPANPVTQAMYDAFQASLVLRLSLCGVTVNVSRSARGVEGPDAGPTHTLMIRIADTTQIVEVHQRPSRYQPHGRIDFEGTLYFGLELEDARSSASVWSARSAFTSPTGDDDENAGTGFARGIVTQLQRDGLLIGCVHESYPGCLADRREGLQRAARSEDNAERVKAVNSLPVCQ